jgi:hypothetical protein
MAFMTGTFTAGEIITIIKKGATPYELPPIPKKNRNMRK